MESGIRDSGFQERLSRIAGRSGQAPSEPPITQLAEYIDRNRAFSAQRLAERATQGRGPGTTHRAIMMPFRMLRAALAGALIFLILRAVRFHLFPDTIDLYQLDAMLFLDGAWAILIGFGARVLLATHMLRLQLAQMVGVVAMVFGMHNLYHWTPNIMAATLSADWSEERRLNSVPGSIYFQKRYYRWNPDELRFRLQSPAVYHAS